LNSQSGTKVKFIQESKFSEFNSEMLCASEILAAGHVPVEPELPDRFVENGAELPVTFRAEAMTSLSNLLFTGP
jgi:hypothetical protein